MIDEQVIFKEAKLTIKKRLILQWLSTDGTAICSPWKAGKLLISIQAKGLLT